MRIVIAEDSVLLRAGIARLLGDAGHDVVAAVSSVDDLLRSVADTAPDLAVVDVRMPPTFTDEGIRAAVLIRSTHPATSVLVLSQYVEERYAADLIAGRSAAFGYLLKDRVADVAEFLRAVDSVGAGGTVLDPEVVAQIVARSRRHDELAALSDRERDVLRLMATGYTNTAIAAELFLAESSVEKHVSNIMSKLSLPQEAASNRRVLAVLTYLRSSATTAPNGG